MAAACKLGRVGIDDGVVLLVAKDNPKALRRLRIEAGRGVQGVLTDAQSKRILEDTIAPYFRRQDWYGGLHAGVGAIEVLLDQETFAAPRRYTRSQVAGYAVPAVFAFVGLVFVIGGVIVIRAERRSRRKPPRRRRVRRDTASTDSTPPSPSAAATAAARTAAAAAAAAATSPATADPSTAAAPRETGTIEPPRYNGGLFFLFAVARTP